MVHVHVRIYNKTLLLYIYVPEKSGEDKGNCRHDIADDGGKRRRCEF